MSQWPQHGATAEFESNKVAITIVFSLGWTFSSHKPITHGSFYEADMLFILIIIDTEVPAAECSNEYICASVHRKGDGNPSV